MSATTNSNPRINRISSSPRPEPTHEEIAVSAMTICQAEGQPQGREMEHWLLAEARLRQECKATSDAALGDQPRRARRTDSQRTRTNGVVL